MATDCPHLPHRCYHCTPEIINMRKSQAWHRCISCSLYLFATFPGPRSLCPLSFSYHRLPRNLNFNQSGYKYGARSLALGRASLLSTAIFSAIGALPILYLSDTHLPFQATGALPTLYLSDSRPSFPPPSVLLQVRCSLSSSPMRISLFPHQATGALPAFYLPDAHLPFPALSVELQVPCTLSTSLTRITPFHRWLSGNRPSAALRSTTRFPTAGFPVKGSFSPPHLMCISLFVNPVFQTRPAEACTTSNTVLVGPVKYIYKNSI